MILTLALICSFSVTAFADCGGGDACTCCGCGGKGTCGEAVEAPKSDCEKPCEKTCTVRITRQPVEETSLNNQRSSTYFLVYAENAVSYQWFCKIGRDGDVMSVREAIEIYGVNAEGYDTNKLWLYSNSSNGWEGINGWWWMCKAFDCNGCPVSSKWVATATVADVCTPCVPCVPCVPCTPCTPASIVLVPDCGTPACGGYSAPVCGGGYTVTDVTTTFSSETHGTTTTHEFYHW